MLKMYVKTVKSVNIARIIIYLNAYELLINVRLTIFKKFSVSINK
jgi:hypothetical protein